MQATREQIYWNIISHRCSVALTPTRWMIDTCQRPSGYATTPSYEY